jgi:hypothetical protein
MWQKSAFEESEVFEVVRVLNGGKAMSLDGFSVAFFQTCWEVIKEDFINVFQEFHLRGKLKKALMQVLFPASLRKLRLWILRTSVH